MYRNGSAAPSPFAGSQALGPFRRICAEVWAGYSGQEQQDPLEAQQGTAQVEPRRGRSSPGELSAAKLKHCSLSSFN